MASQLSAISGRNPFAPTNFGPAVLANSGNAYQAALLRDQNKYTQQNLDIANQGLALQRQQAEQGADDAKRASYISALGLAPRLYGMFDKSGTADAINAGGEGAGSAATAVTNPVAAGGTSGIGDTVSGAWDTVKGGAADLFGESAASGLSLAGLGKGALGAYTGSKLGKTDLEKGLIGAATPALINVGQALWEGTSIVDSLTSSLFPSVGGALGAIFL
jgi:hypothetical protein